MRERVELLRLRREWQERLDRLEERILGGLGTPVSLRRTCFNHPVGLRRRCVCFLMCVASVAPLVYRVSSAA